MMDTRKLVLHKGSYSAHCCFSASALAEGEKYGNSIFEAFEEKDAVEIIKRWNAYHDDQGLEVHRLLVIGTEHISLSASGYLPAHPSAMMYEPDNRSCLPGGHVDAYEHGWHITLSDEIDPEDEWPDPSLQAVCDFARAHNCTHLRIDRDGPTVPGLPTYNW